MRRPQYEEMQTLRELRTAATAAATMRVGRDVAAGRTEPGGLHHSSDFAISLFLPTGEQNKGKTFCQVEEAAGRWEGRTGPGSFAPMVHLSGRLLCCDREVGTHAGGHYIAALYQKENMFPEDGKRLPHWERRTGLEEEAGGGYS